MFQIKLRKFLFLALSLAGILFSVFPILPIQAEESEDNVIDLAEILTEEEVESLDAYAKRITNAYDCGVYIFTVDDGGDDIPEMADYVYHELTGWGVGEDKDGIMLMLSMEERDYAILTNGDWGKTAFSNYATGQLENVFLDDFHNNNWYAGFTDYIDACDEYLALAEAGTPVNRPMWQPFLIILGVSAGIALIITLILNSKMKSVHTAVTAKEYTTGRLSLNERQDIYVNTTTSRVRIDRDSSSSSSSVSTTSHGSSVRSGKF